MTDELLTIAEAAERMGGVHRATVYREHAAGRLAIVKVGGATRIRASEIERYLRSRERRHRRAA